MTNFTATPETVASLTIATPAKAKKTVKPSKKKAQATKAAIRAAKAFSAAKVAEARAKERKERAEVILREALAQTDGAEILTVDTPVGPINLVEVMHSSNSRIDAAALLARFPEAHKATYVSKPYTYLKTV